MPPVRVALPELQSSTPSLSPAARNRIDDLRLGGISVEAMPLCGPGFWQSVEIERCDALIEASTSALDKVLDAIRRDTAVV